MEDNKRVQDRLCTRHERRDEILRDLVVIMEQIEMISLSFGASVRSKSLLNKMGRRKDDVKNKSIDSL